MNKSEMQIRDIPMSDFSLYEVAAGHYPLQFATAERVKSGLLLKGEAGEYYLLKRYPGNGQALHASIEAEGYLEKRGFSWTLPSISLTNGRTSLEQGGQGFYLKEWHPEVETLPYRCQIQLGSEVLARVHLAGEGFHPDTRQGWAWPDWVKLFILARDAIYDMHTRVVTEDSENLSKYFDSTAKEAIYAIEEAIVHLKSAGYYEQREEGIRRGYVNLSHVPAPSLGMCFDLVNSIAPDLPACGLGAYLGQMSDWSEPRAINDIIDLLTIYNSVRRVSADEVELIKAFLKFPWQFWWSTEEYLDYADTKKRYKRYTKALKSVFSGPCVEIRNGLQEI